MPSSSGSRRLSIVAVAFSVSLVLWSPASAAAVHRVNPSLRFVHRAGYQLVVAGRGWRPWSPVIFSVRVGAISAGLEVKATRRGAFAIALSHLSLCSEPEFAARDLRSHHASLHGPPLGCPLPANPPMPVLKIIQGKRSAPAVYRIAGIVPRSVNMRLGDELYIQEDGATLPAYLPYVNAYYLTLVRAGRSSGPGCQLANCNTNYFWEYAATRLGETVIDMSPACRQVRPPCEAPDFGISVKISP